MMKKLLPILLALSLAACLEDEQNAVYNTVGSGGYAAEVAEEAMMMDMAVASAPPPMAQHKRAMKMRPSDMVLDRSKFQGRHIAENHSLSVEVEKEKLKDRYQSDMQTCLSLGCEVIGSRIQSRGTGYLNARIAPETLGDYLNHLGKGEGEIESHQVSANDKTSQYVDTESKLKNQTAMRDRLLKLLDSYKARKIEDILSVERELTRVQSQIDSLTGQMRALQNVTAKATVNVSYKIPPKAVEIKYHDIGNSLRYAWNGFLRSVSDVVTFIFRMLPWVPVWFVAGWLLVKIFRFAFRKTGATWQKLKFWKDSKES